MFSSRARISDLGSYSRQSHRITPPALFRFSLETRPPLSSARLYTRSSFQLVSIKNDPLHFSRSELSSVRRTRRTIRTRLEGIPRFTDFNAHIHTHARAFLLQFLPIQESRDIYRRRLK